MTVTEVEYGRGSRREVFDLVVAVDGGPVDVDTFDRDTFEGVPCRRDRMAWADQRPGEDWKRFQSRLDRTAETCLSACARVRECRALAKSLGWPEGVWGGLVSGFGRGVAVNGELGWLASETGVEWRRASDPDYAVSADGRVVNLRTGRVLKGYVSEGVVNVSLRGRRRPVQLLVLEAFGGVRPRGMVAGRVNGDRWDNRVENLRWVPRGTKREPATHCPQGHAYDAENTDVSPSGLRRCRVCRAGREGKGLARCSRGHALDAENTYVDPAGRSRCRECRAMSDLKRTGKSVGAHNESGGDFL